MSRNVNFGLWYDLRSPAAWPVPFERLYAESLDQIVWAEGLGIDSVWLTEHHFREDGYTPSPLIIAAAIAARTKKIRVGTNLLLLPLYDPVRLAEDAAAVSLLAGGRFDLGVGGGFVEKEFETFGRKLKQRPSALEEGIEILRRAWTGEPFSFNGKRFQLDDVCVSPVPEHTPRILLGGIEEPAIDRAARVADGFLSSGNIGHEIYSAALLKAGKKPGEGRIYAGCWGIIADDPEAEFAALGEHLQYQMNEYIKMGAGAFDSTGDTPLFETPTEAVENGFYEFWTPDEAVTKILALIEEYPQIVDLHFWAQFPGESIASGSRRIELLATRVLPQVRSRLG
jgi:alkanesulfonate monooxygenase SsuD/methylene tetrahydromethanopterin reductase-like flavin-dependent oxidoreductase (luciferase family)